VNIYLSFQDQLQLPLLCIKVQTEIYFQVSAHM